VTDLKFTEPIKIVSCHAEGEVGDVIISGVGEIPGSTLWEKSRFIATDEKLRNYVLREPRGGVFRHVNLFVKPINQEAKVGFVIMEPEDTPPMSGSNSICVATVALETGVIPITGEIMNFKMEAPGGLVNVTATIKGKKVTQIRVTNVPSFAGVLNAKLEVEGLGNFTVDTAFGGDSFVIINANDLGFKIAPDEARELAEVGMKITRAANEQLTFKHPTNPDWRHFSFTQIAKPIFYEDGVAISHNAVAIQPGKIDRSPTGTGCSARLALLHAKGELKLGDRMIGRSIIGSHFDCRIEEELDLNGTKAIRPSIAGQAWITGTYEHRLDPTDPYPLGYKLSDTWPNKL
jgi:proline racemase